VCATVREREWADDQQVNHAIRAMDDPVRPARTFGSRPVRRFRSSTLRTDPTRNRISESFAVHVRDAVGQGFDEQDDVLPYARERDPVVVASDVTDSGALSNEVHAGIVRLHDDTMSAYRVAPALIGTVDT
jgi:hypothetical protein